MPLLDILVVQRLAKTRSERSPKLTWMAVFTAMTECKGVHPREWDSHEHGSAMTGRERRVRTIGKYAKPERP